MIKYNKTASVILAGGKSSRMQTNKAFMPLKNGYLIDHMMDILKKIGFKDNYISGNIDSYKNIPDLKPFNGPASAISQILNKFYGNYEGILFIPVDMPLLSSEVLVNLLNKKNQTGAYYKNYPLPVYIKNSDIPYISQALSVKKLLNIIGVTSYSLPLKFKKNMLNVNTIDDWETYLQYN